MPLRDHFRPPVDDITSWDTFHGGWPMMIVLALEAKLPPGFTAGPHVHLGSFAEVDVGTFERDGSAFHPDSSGDGGLATATWAPPKPSRTLETDLSVLDEYEVRVYDNERGRRLVASIEIVSPANKDRPEHRQAFVTKCAALLQQQVAVSIVDLVTTRQFNLFHELLPLIDQGVAGSSLRLPNIYAVSCRMLRKRFESWEQPLAVGQPLPTLPIWLSEDLVIPLDLEPTYEQTCRALRIP